MEDGHGLDDDTAPATDPKAMKTLGALLILFTGLLNFHIPHFLIEPTSREPATTLLEAVFLANVTAAAVSAIAIALGRSWGWRLGVVVAAVSFLLYVAQETIGLPGLPQNWLEPSRIVAVVFEGLFVLVAVRSLGARHLGGRN